MSDDNNRTIFVLDPTAPPRDLRQDMAVRTPNLGGRRVGFLWNSKPNGDTLFSRLEELLREKYEITGVAHHRKPTSSAPATGEALDQLAEAADVVVVGLAD